MDKFAIKLKIWPKVQLLCHRETQPHDIDKGKQPVTAQESEITLHNLLFTVLLLQQVRQ